MDHPPAEVDELRLIAYRIHPTGMRLIPSDARRPWMDATPSKFANRCLPLLLGNQAGWLLLNDATVRLRWTGDAEKGGVEVAYDGDPPRNPALSHFGSGIVTWSVPYLFRTPSGWNLAVRGAPNNPRSDAQPLDALVETDWAVSPFTMNWQLMTRDEVVVHEGEPLCFLFPQRRGELEAFVPEIRDLAGDPKLAAAVHEWTSSRAGFLEQLHVPDSDANRRGWQKDYFRGRQTEDQRYPNHQTKLRLRPFVDLGAMTEAEDDDGLSG